MAWLCTYDAPFRHYSILHPATSSQVDGFLDKNRDTFSNDLFDLLQTSRSAHLLELFKGEKGMV